MIATPMEQPVAAMLPTDIPGLEKLPFAVQWVEKVMKAPDSLGGAEEQYPIVIQAVMETGDKFVLEFGSKIDQKIAAVRRSSE